MRKILIIIVSFVFFVPFVFSLSVNFNEYSTVTLEDVQAEVNESQSTGINIDPASVCCSVCYHGCIHASYERYDCGRSYAGFGWRRRNITSFALLFSPDFAYLDGFVCHIGVGG